MNIHKKPKVIIVLPAYNAERTLEMTYRNIPEGVADEVLLVDDASKDRTVEVARALGIKTIVHPENRGYGGNQKTCYTEALRDGADVVLMLHPDFQYDPKDIPDLLRPIQERKADAVIGSRMMVKGMAKKGGMPLWKRLGNKFLTSTMNLMLGQRMSEYHSGYRAYSRRLLEAVNFCENSDGFIFDTEIIIQALAKGLQFTEVPIAIKYFPEASSVNFQTSVSYGLGSILAIIKYYLHC